MKNFTATYNGKTITVKANNQMSAYYEAKKIFKDAHWSEVSIVKQK